LLNGFGRAFKSAGFTMMGAQEKVEGEHLSLPSVLNLGILTTSGYDTVSGSVANLKGGNKAWFVPASGGELSLFIGGRISEFAGFLTEMGMGAAASTGASKIALMFPVGESHVGLVAHTSNGQGVAYSYETLNTGAVNTHKMSAANGNNQGAVTGVFASAAAAAAGQAALVPAPTLGNGGHTGVYSASQYLGTNTAATGLSLVASNDNMGFINIGKYDIAGVGTGNAGSLPLTYIRVAGLFEAAGFDMGAGIQSFSGTSQVGVNAQAKATVIDFQAQGEVSGMGLGIYTSYGTAPSVAGGTNAFNAANVQTRNTFNIGAELGVIPGISTVQLAFRSAKSGAAAGADGSNAFSVGGTYELAQNLELSLTHTAQTGSEWNVPVGGVAVGKDLTTIMMEALF